MVGPIHLLAWLVPFTCSPRHSETQSVALALSRTRSQSHSLSVALGSKPEGILVGAAHLTHIEMLL
jgi:hypothetical protein